LSITPLIFCLLGSALILRFNRGGRGFGIIVALACLIAYYLLAFLGEQLARTEKITVFEGSLIPLAASVAAIVWFGLSGKLAFVGRFWDYFREIISKIDFRWLRARRANLFVDVTTGIRDFDLIISILKYYLLVLCFLAAVFIIFTAFELWKFAGTIDGGIVLLVKYLFYLLPFIYIQLAPSAAMIATLAVYVIKSRQNEIVTWTSAGQSVYRLLLPCLLLMVLLGILNWQIQERVAPAANQRQDELRTQIRSRGVLGNKSGKYWVANDRRIYSFELGDREQIDRDHNPTASDNAKRSTTLCSPVCLVKNLLIYEFNSTGEKLQALYQVESAVWEVDRIRFTGAVEKSMLGEDRIVTAEFSGGELSELSNPFAEMRKKPSHLNIAETRAQMENSESDFERRSFGVALDKKYATIFLPFVIALFTAPFALSLSRKGKVLTIGYAVGLWLLFTGLTSTFEQFGLNGYLTPSFAVWSPLALFSLLGIYLLSKVRT